MGILEFYLLMNLGMLVYFSPEFKTNAYNSTLNRQDLNPDANQPQIDCEYYVGRGIVKRPEIMLVQRDQKSGSEGFDSYLHCHRRFVPEANRDPKRVALGHRSSIWLESLRRELGVEDLNKTVRFQFAHMDGVWAESLNAYFSTALVEDGYRVSNAPLIALEPCLGKSGDELIVIFDYKPGAEANLLRAGLCREAKISWFY